MAFPQKTASELECAQTENGRKRKEFALLDGAGRPRAAAGGDVLLVSGAHRPDSRPLALRRRGRQNRAIDRAGRRLQQSLFGKTGPTAWLAPVFPYLLAGIFKILGVYSKASAIAALALDCLFSALTCIPIFFHCQQTFWGERRPSGRDGLGHSFPTRFSFQQISSGPRR